MKKIVAFLAIGAMCMSCSNDDDNQKDEFFNLAEGNVWVYKRYHASPENPDGVFLNRIDTLKVDGYAVLDGKKYYRVTHSFEPKGEGKDEFLRVDDNGHLVNIDGLVLHPGKDTQYKYTSVLYNGQGELDYKLGDVTNITVENKNYTVYPYIGDFKPTDPKITGGVGAFQSYQKGLGFVVKHCRYVSSKAYFEDRLVYSQVK